MTNSTGFLLRFQDGTKYSFDQAGRLSNCVDRIGNTLTYLYPGTNQPLSTVVDEFGREIDFLYDANGLLTNITDFSGRQCNYSYDANSNLVAVRSPVVTNTPHGNDFPNGKTERYVYDTGKADSRLAHNLTACIAPNEVADGSLTPRETCIYGQAGNDYDRVLACTVGGTNATGVGAGGTLQYSYDLAPVGGPPGTVSKTTVTDRNGNVCEYYHDAEGHCLQALDDAGGSNYLHRMSYNHHGELTQYTLPESNRVAYNLDDANPDRFQQGNLLSMTRTPDAPRGGDQAQIKTSYTYEPLYNRVLTRTGPRGNDATYVPQNGGVQSAGRYATTNTYDYQETNTTPPEATAWGISIPVALLGKGDVNEDGRTDQAMGNRVMSDGPTVNLLPGSNQALAEGDTSQEIITRYVYNDFGQLVQSEDPRGNIDTFGYYAEQDPDGDGQDVIAGSDASTGGYRQQRVTDALIGPRRQDTNAPPVAITNAYAYDRRGNATNVTDGRGLQHKTAHNQLDQVVETEAPKVDVSQAHGYLRQFFYDILNNLVEQIRDATRDAAIPASLQPEQLTTRYEYDANENRIRAISPLAVAGSDSNNVARTLYDERDLVVAVTRGEGATNESTWTYGYDANGNRTTWTDAEDNDAVPGPETRRSVYDGFDRVRSGVDRAGNELHYAYDPGSRIVRRVFEGPADGGGGTNEVLASHDRRYDELGRRFQVDADLFLPAGVSLACPDATLDDGPLTPGDQKVSERYEYDALDRLTHRVEDDGFVYEHVYDGADRRVAHFIPLVDDISPGGPHRNRTEYAYDGNNNLLRRIEHHVNPDGLVAPARLEYIHVYDAVDRLVRQTDTKGYTRYREYDSRNNTVSSYDARAARIPDPLGLYTNGSINLRGNPLRYAYDGINRLWQAELALHVAGRGDLALSTNNPFNADGFITMVVEYDGNGRIARRTDDNTNSIAYEYDALNRVVRQTNADGGFRTMIYDRDQHRVALIDENNTLHTHTYDGLSRATRHELTYDPAKFTAFGALPLLVGTTLRTFEYDGLSRLTRSLDNNDPGTTNDDWVVERRYDSLSRIVRDDQNGRLTEYGYTADDRTELCYPGSNRVVRYTYDEHDQLVEIANINEIRWTQGYAGNCPCPIFNYHACVTGYQTNIVVTNSMTLTNIVAILSTNLCKTTMLNQNKFPVEAELRGGSNALTQLWGDYFYFDDRNNMAQDYVRHYIIGPTNILEDNIWNNQSDGALGDSFCYREIHKAATVIEEVEHDRLYGGARDLRRQISEQGGATNTENRSHSETYENTSFSRKWNSSPGTGILTFEFRPAPPRYWYQWDGLNRLRRLVPTSDLGAVEVRYTYDAAPEIAGGRRVEKDVASGPLAGTTRYYYDGWNCIEERAVTGGVERVARQYIYGDLADQLVAMHADSGADGDLDRTYFYATDWNNNVTHLVNADDGTPQEFYVYDIGAPPRVFDAATLTEIGSVSPAGNPYLFTGRRYDPETAYYYYRARLLDPRTMEFVSRDPIGFWGDASHFGNPHAYADNNPWNRRDPSGLQEEESAAMNVPALQCFDFEVGEIPGSVAGLWLQPALAALTHLAMTALPALSTVHESPSMTIPDMYEMVTVRASPDMTVPDLDVITLGRLAEYGDVRDFHVSPGGSVFDQPRVEVSGRLRPERQPVAMGRSPGEYLVHSLSRELFGKELSDLSSGEFRLLKAHLDIHFPAHATAPTSDTRAGEDELIRSVREAAKQCEEAFRTRWGRRGPGERVITH